jgi:hypothetical protein
MQLTREFYIPTGARKVAHKLSSAVAYLYEYKGVPYAVVFHGKSAKPCWRYSFATPLAREHRIARFFTARAEHDTARAKRQAERKQAGRGLGVGDVLSAMWGYEQTNIDYYEITALIGNTMVEVRKIAAEREETEWQQGKTVPLPGHFTSEPMRRKASQGGVRIDETRHASKLEPLAVIGGKPVYAAEHFTAYH